MKIIIIIIIIIIINDIKIIKYVIVCANASGSR